MPMISRLAVIIALAATAGCSTTQLDVRPVGPPSDVASRTGMVYFLPFTQFDTKITWTVTDCKPAPDIAVEVSAASATAADPDGAYVIDPTSLNSWAKTSNIDIGYYPDGQIKSINASTEDHTAQIAGSIVGAIGKLAPLLVGAPPLQDVKDNKEAGGPPPPPPPPPPTCSAKVLQNLAMLPAKKQQIADQSDELDTETFRLERLLVRLTRQGDSPDPALIKEIEAQEAVVGSIRQALKLSRAELAKITSFLSFTQTVRFPERSTQFTADSGELISPAKTLAWLADPASAPAFRSESSVWLALCSNSALGAGGKTLDTAKPGQGLRYRVAVPGRLMAFGERSGGLADGRCPGQSVERQAIISEPVRIAHAGTTMYLRFSSEPFTSPELKVNFDERGAMSAASFGQRKAPGKEFAGMVDSVADTAASTVASVRTARLDAIKRQTDIAKATKDYADAQRSLGSDPNSDVIAATKALELKTALKKAELADLQAEDALAKAKAQRETGTQP